MFSFSMTQNVDTALVTRVLKALDLKNTQKKTKGKRYLHAVRIVQGKTKLPQCEAAKIVNYIHTYVTNPVGKVKEVAA